jgi:hypothetical protein
MSVKAMRRALFVFALTVLGLAIDANARINRSNPFCRSSRPIATIERRAPGRSV